MDTDSEPTRDHEEEVIFYVGPKGLRPGQPAEIVGVKVITNAPRRNEACFCLRHADGQTDHVPIGDVSLDRDLRTQRHIENEIERLLGRAEQLTNDIDRYRCATR